MTFTFDPLYFSGLDDLPITSDLNGGWIICYQLYIWTLCRPQIPHFSHLVYIYRFYLFRILYRSLERSPVSVCNMHNIPSLVAIFNILWSQYAFYDLYSFFWKNVICQFLAQHDILFKNRGNLYVGIGYHDY